jgi:hypothetical protein
MRARCNQRWAELHAERETTQARLDALDQARARDDDASLIDDLPVLAGTLDLHPERIQAALYQAFDIQALYKPDMHQVTLFATITTSTPRAVAAIISDAGHDPAHAHAPAQPPPETAASTPAVYPLAQPPMRRSINHDHETPGVGGDRRGRRRDEFLPPVMYGRPGGCGSGRRR